MLLSRAISAERAADALARPNRELRAGRQDLPDTASLTIPSAAGPPMMCTAEVFSDKCSKDTLSGLISAQAADSDRQTLSEQLLKQLDTDGDGRLSRAELLAGRTADVASERAGEALEKLQASLRDADPAATLDAAGLKAQLAKIDLPDLELDDQSAVKSAFDAWDTDKDGVVSGQELRAALGAVGQELVANSATPDADILTRAVQQLDRSGDDGLDLEELRSAIADRAAGRFDTPQHPADASAV